MPTNSKPQTEVDYCWREFCTVEGEDKPRLIVPWADPMVHEFPMDWLFATPKEARESKAEIAPDEDWVLCKRTLEPIKE
jgi:hypothetical protein